MKIDKSVLQFLKKIKKNNDRDWFAKNKPAYQIIYDDLKLFYSEIEAQLNKTDEIERVKVYRIYRDIRFSKDKTPYKSYLAGSFIRASNRRRGGYYLHVEPGNSFVAGGFFSPNSADLKRIRQEFEADDTEIRSILKDRKFKNAFGNILGEELKSAPRGFSVEHPAIDLIRKKQYYAHRDFTDDEVMSPDFSTKVVKSFLILRPFFDYMSDVLTTDLNGESII